MTVQKHFLSALLGHWHAKAPGTRGVFLHLPIEGIASPQELVSAVREAERLLYFENVEEGLGPHGLVFVVDLTVRGQEVFGIET